MTLELCTPEAFKTEARHGVGQHVVHMLVPCTAAAHNPCMPISACATPGMQCKAAAKRASHAGWQYKGSFIKGKSKPFGKHDLGAMWECPFLTPLKEPSNAHPAPEAPSDSVGPLQLKEGQLYMMCVSPYPHFLKDRLTNPCLYWLGHVQQELFMIEESDGMAYSIVHF